MLRNKNIGNVVAAEMIEVLNSEDYKTMFNKEASAKPKHASVAQNVELEVAEKTPKETFAGFASRFTALSEDLDNYGFEKTASVVLNSFQVLLKEAAGELKSNPTHIEEMLEKALEELNPSIDVDIDMDEPLDIEVSGEEFDERLLMEEDDDGMSLEEQLAAIEEMNLGEEPLSLETRREMKERGLGGLAKEIAEANSKIDAWLKVATDHNDMDDSTDNFLEMLMEDVDDSSDYMMVDDKNLKEKVEKVLQQHNLRLDFFKHYESTGKVKVTAAKSKGTQANVNDVKEALKKSTGKDVDLIIQTSNVKTESSLYADDFEDEYDA